MIDPSYFRVKGETADLPLMIWPNDDGEMIVQMGRGRPWHSPDHPQWLAELVTDIMWCAAPITSAEWHKAMADGVWPSDGKSSMENFNG